MASSRFARWTTEGQLATLVMAVVFITWLGFTIFVAPIDRPDVLNQVLLAVLGAWITNLSYGVKKSNERADAAENAEEDARLERKVAEALDEQRGRHRA